MNPVDLFMAYAGEFEKSYVDDDWSRIHPFFLDDATYEIKSASMPCLLTGPEAICKGMQKSLNGFDRRFDTREIAVGDDLTADENSLSVSWTVTYSKEGLKPVPVKGRSVATFKDGKIASLCDEFTPEDEQLIHDWIAETGYQVDLSYT